MAALYIHRKLYRGDQLLRDDELLNASGVLVVLAEPGAGKSDLLDYLAHGLSVPRMLASLFEHSPTEKSSALIVDAFDEVARIGEEKINKIIVKARSSGAATIILASRSYVWDEARTQLIRDCFGVEPTILRLEPFDEHEQQQLFSDYLPNEDFVVFRAEADRAELVPILGNPQFLKLLADAYMEGGRRFSSKRQILSDAVRRLATESKRSGEARQRPQIDRIVAAAAEIFAKLLLSGAAGISTYEEIGDDAYPYFRSVGPDDAVLTFALNTRLFKPTSSVSRHEPVHRIVAEYCAAQYLVDRIEDPSSTLTIKRCLAVIAPNGKVRDELRGVLGWMASLGSRTIQERVIDLDPYAVFANGDPSQLPTSSKAQLLKGLERLAEVDPYFRRMDAWRRFSVSGFFSTDVAEHVRSLLGPAYAKSHLRGLLLELLRDIEIATQLQPELRTILHDQSAALVERQQAYEILYAIACNDDIADFEVLVGQGSEDSLRLAARAVVNKGAHHFGRTRTVSLLRALAGLDSSRGRQGYTLASRYFIRELVATFEVNEVRSFLDALTTDFVCVCGKPQAHQCTCRLGCSKIVSIILDRYFSIMIGAHDPGQIARWTGPLMFTGNFHGNITGEECASIQVLSADHGLRRAIQIIILTECPDGPDIGEAATRLRAGLCHHGLNIRDGDARAVVDHAFASRNVPLWQSFVAHHSPYRKYKGKDELRAHMRGQARLVSELLRVWTRADRSFQRLVQSQHVQFGRLHRRAERKETQRENARLEHLRKNRALIESGRHWGWLQLFANQYLYESDDIDNIVDDKRMVENALLNCIDFIAPHVPTLEMLAEQRGSNIAMVLEAACLATFRANGSLDGMQTKILQAVKANSVGGSGYRENEAERFELELDRLLFVTTEAAIVFARRYIEPQLLCADDSETRVHIIANRTGFDAVKGALALDWLTRYPKMPSSARDAIFDIAVTHADRTALSVLIATRCNDQIDSSEVGQKRRKFWLLRHFFFIVPTADALWNEFSADPKTILAIEHYAGRGIRWRGHNERAWPQLNAEQIYRVLDAFVDDWSRVHLPDHWGTGDPEDVTAYRFLSDAIYQIGRDDSMVSIVVFDRLLSDVRFSDFYSEVRSQKAAAVRKLAHAGFRPPRPAEIAKLLEENKIASVEDMRAVLIELLDEIQYRLKGAATDPVDVFYSGDKRVDENTARNRIVDMLEARLNALHLSVVIEHQMASANRCDFTASASIDGSQAVLVVEVKGQWNNELYTAASAQLADRYTIYPGAADQGIYLILWFGQTEPIAGKRNTSIASATELREAVIDSMPESLLGRIDVFALDVSRSSRAKSNAPAKKMHSA